MSVNIAYFSMEIGMESDIPTYSGGLGVLAGDMIKAGADLGLPMVAVSLLYRKGYFKQEINSAGEQVERPVIWDPSNKLKLLPQKIILREIEGRDILVQGWLYTYKGIAGNEVPVIFLDTHIEGNSAEDLNLTNSLYGGGDEWRLKQEILLGIGGIKYLRALGFRDIHTFHMNEGHSSLLTLELLQESERTILETWDEDTIWDYDKVKSQCVFTTHTPVPAGHDVFPYDMVDRVLKTGVPLKILKKIGGQGQLNMTTLGLNLSRFANGVAKVHGDVSKDMFQGYDINFITNGVHVFTWVHKPFEDLYDKHLDLWRYDPQYLRQAENIPSEEVWQAHLQCKTNLFDEISKQGPQQYDPDILTIGFARRSTSYKRWFLLFNDLDRLIDLAEQTPGIQLVYAGKSHPMDPAGKENIRHIHSLKEKIRKRTDKLKLAYVPNYNMDLGFLITGGVDLWLNTPVRPQEASGTSGMKAVLNGVLNLSILDGWWVEGCIEDVTGWAIGDMIPRQDLAPEEMDHLDANSLYEKLEQVVLPKYYKHRQDWIAMQKHAIAINASFFNSHRQMEQYVAQAYFNHF